MEVITPGEPSARIVTLTAAVVSFLFALLHAGFAASPHLFGSYQNARNNPVPAHTTHHSSRPLMSSVRRLTRPCTRPPSLAGEGQSRYTEF